MVPETDDKEGKNGSVVQLVPRVSDPFNGGIHIDIPTLTVVPAFALSSFTMKLKVVGPTASGVVSDGKIRVHRKKNESTTKPIDIDPLGSALKIKD